MAIPSPACRANGSDREWELEHIHHTTHPTILACGVPASPTCHTHLPHPIATPTYSTHLPHPPTPPTCHTHLRQRHSCECVHGQPSPPRQSNRPRQTTCPNNGGSSQHTLGGGHLLLGNCMISIITQIYQYLYHHSSNHSNQRLMSYVISHNTSLKDVSSSKQWMDTLRSPTITCCHPLSLIVIHAV